MLIGFGYAARVGKDTACDYLCETHRFHRWSFACILKIAAGQIFGLSENQLYGSEKEVVDPRWGMSPREILQKLGTDCLRNTFGKDVWVKALETDLESYGYTRACISDVRFQEEFDWVKSKGGICVKIERDTGVKISGADHESENALTHETRWDYVISNNGSFEDFYKKLDRLVAGEKQLCMIGG